MDIYPFSFTISSLFLLSLIHTHSSNVLIRYVYYQLMINGEKNFFYIYTGEIGCLGQVVSCVISFLSYSFFSSLRDLIEMRLILSLCFCYNKLTLAFRNKQSWIKEGWRNAYPVGRMLFFLLFYSLSFMLLFFLFGIFPICSHKIIFSFFLCQKLPYIYADVVLFAGSKNMLKGLYSPLSLY